MSATNSPTRIPVYEGCNPFSNDIEGSIYEIIIDDDTMIEGTKDRFDELEVGDNVEIWVENQEADEKSLFFYVNVAVIQNKK